MADTPPTICKHYQQGRCRHGDSCRHKHVDETPPVEIVLTAGTTASTEEGRRAVLERDEHRRHHDHREHGDMKKAPVKCSHWVKNGTCKHGDSCRNLHPPPSPPPPPKFPPPTWGDPLETATNYTNTTRDKEDAQWAADDTKSKWFTVRDVLPEHISPDGNFFITRHFLQEGTNEGESSYTKHFAKYKVHRLAPPLVECVKFYKQASSSDTRMHDKSERGEYNMCWDPDQPATMRYEKRHISSWTSWDPETKRNEFKRRHDVSKEADVFKVDEHSESVDDSGW